MKILSGMRSLKQKSRAAFCFLIAFVLLSTAFEGVLDGWYRWLPGPMSRHRDAVAVAITEVAYKKWLGYASYHAVNHALLRDGLSVQSDDFLKTGEDSYFAVIRNPALVDRALYAASHLSAPASEGLFYSQDEKGMAILFICAFAIFGIGAGSLFWLYFLLYGSSVIVACVTFWRQTRILFLLLIVVCGHAFIAHLLPTMMRMDVSVIYSNRFLGVMATVPMLHLMLLIDEQARMSILAVLVACFQTLIICLVVAARTTALWLPLSIILYWLVRMIRYPRKPAPEGKPAKPRAWPVCVLLVGLCSLAIYDRLEVNIAFRNGEAEGGHIFWHNLLTALHNNPLRTKLFSIPADMRIYDDQVSYLLFDREIGRLGENRSKYLAEGPDWIYRTTRVEWNFRWQVYDGLLKKVFWRTITAHPLYSFCSLALYQPYSAAKLILGPSFLWNHRWIDPPAMFALICGVILAAACGHLVLSGDYLMLFVASAGVFAPVLCAATDELRVVELFYFLLLFGIILASNACAKLLGMRQRSD
jgi:hypothetical protein